MPQQLSSETPADVIDDPQLSSNPERKMAWKVATNLFVSFRFAGAGVVYAFRTQRNFRIHVVIGLVAIALSLVLHLTRVEIAVIGLTIGAVLAMELINTALESVVDLTVQQTYHELAKIAKDCAAAAVLVSALVSIWVAGVLILPPLFNAVLEFASTSL
ncbi:MAG: diacylglycerol kinase family protein [Synechococcales bacterium]|nr:diacylglycerol kinase family protein [Synechococcales bacterium]